MKILVCKRGGLAHIHDKLYVHNLKKKMLRSDFAAFLYSKVFLLLTMHDLCREKEARNLKVEANFAAL